jgi:molybdate transport system substrate-binding protein
MADAIKVMAAGAVELMVTLIGDEFERASGRKLNLTFMTVGKLRESIEAGEQADLVVLSASAIKALDRPGRFVPGSITDLGRTVTGVAVRAGAPRPDISTEKAFVAALMNAKSVSYNDPKGGGTSGVLFAKLLARLGIADAINKKAVLRSRGLEVVKAVANGEAELGTTFISEILAVPGASVLGPLPPGLEDVNTYTAAIPVGSPRRDDAAAFLKALTDPLTRHRWAAAGMEPAF